MKKLINALDVTTASLNDINFMLKNRIKTTYFTRGSGKLSFQNIILFALNFIKMSIQLELDNFFSKIIGGDQTITKQAYSQARQKISPEAFVTIYEDIIRWYYDDDSFKTFRGYRLSAIDGTVLQINNSEKLRDAYGYAENKTVKLARAQASGIFDIENNMIIASKIKKYGVGERDLAIELIEQLKRLGLKKDLILFDRGYPAIEFIKYLEDSKIKYLMRVSSRFFSSINTAKNGDIVEIKYQGEFVKIKVIRVQLSSGVEETLITNLIDDTISDNQFRELYFKRWGIETKFNELKSRLQIENFTGDTPISVEQDFYATMYLSNMSAIAKAEADEKIKQNHSGKVLKYDYKVNVNMLIGKLKDSLVMILIEDRKEKRTAMLNDIIDQLQRNVIPIRPDRSFKRNMSLKANKYPMNKKRTL